MFSFFFDNIGKTIKIIGIVNFVLGFLGALACLIAAMVIKDPYFLLGCPGSVIFFSILSFFVYGYGEIIEHQRKIERLLKEKSQADVLPKI